MKPRLASAKLLGSDRSCALATAALVCAVSGVASDPVALVAAGSRLQPLASTARQMTDSAEALTQAMGWCKCGRRVMSLPWFADRSCLLWAKADVLLTTSGGFCEVLNHESNVLFSLDQ